MADADKKVHWTKTPKGKAILAARKAKEKAPKKKAIRKTTTRGDNDPEPTQDYSNHISYLFGKVETIIDHYSAGAFVPRAPLARGLAELLLHKEGGKVLGS